jgi:PAS domain S-box-containing protein
MIMRGRDRAEQRSGGNRLQAVLAIAAVIVLANLFGLIDTILHPGSPYFESEHVVVGVITAAAAGLLVGLLLLRTRRLAVLVDEQQRTVAALERSEHRYRLLAESMKDVVWILDAETLRFLYVSPSIAQLRGFTAEEVMATSFEDVFMPEDRAGFLALLGEQVDQVRRGEIQQGAFFTNELRQPCKDGSWIWSVERPGFRVGSFNWKPRWSWRLPDGTAREPRGVRAA